MKSLLAIIVLSATFNTFAAEKVCSVEGNKIKVTVPSKVAVTSINKVLNSTISEQEKVKSIKSLLYIDGISIGDSKSFCDQIVAKKLADQEKCLDALTSSEVIHDILDTTTGVSLDCRIGITAHLLLNFNM